ncbi:MAG: alpha-glucan family phosphorylase, partial [Bacteroidales bacterium]|nr:alpha-glucan family phosphorylase [Bacteroidales bacterium]
MDTLRPDYIFETSWEICNKVGGIHTVISTKALTLAKEFKDNLILIGPDLMRETGKNPEFEEDRAMFRAWRKKVENQGLKIRVGRWKIIGKPLVFLVDFSSLFARKDEIFAEFWEEYGLDSISGQWDYVEPAMFGYAAAQIIESFYLHHMNGREKVVAHFHEWMTGTGVLYLKKQVPQIANVFTTHATILGRSLAGNRLPLYKNIKQYDGDAKAKEFNIVSKQSLEKISAREADGFTTVSDITAKECVQFLEKEIDLVTPNGFEDNFVPKGEDYKEKQSDSRALIRKVAENLLGYELTDDVRFISTSGRYEFWNKGIDMFIDALDKINKREGFNKEIVAFILVPANNYGARKDLIEKMNGNHSEVLDNKFLTHYLHDAEFDPSLQMIKKLGFTNEKNQAAKIIFVPTYLNGDDGIFDVHYYDVLIGMDLTVYASYYEPWGYTPLESMAFHVPSITTTLAGYGKWINQQNIDTSECISVVERNDDNYEQSVKDISDKIVYCSYKSLDELRIARENAYFVSRTALWKNLVKYYYQAYDIALKSKNARTKDFVFKHVREPIGSLKKLSVNKPNWRTVTIEPNLPDNFQGLNVISQNLWWAWNDDAIELFKTVSPRDWDKSGHNPIKLLKEISFSRLKSLEEDSDFLNLYHKVYNRFKEYMKQGFRSDVPEIAYFSMEYGIANPLKIYSGGLGILAGDYLKQASDSAVDMVAVGFLYKYGYFTQKLSINGDQMVSYEAQNFSDLPIELQKDKEAIPILVRIALPGRSAYAQIWKVMVGRVPLYLLDTDLERNRQEDRNISHHLYGGNNENRLKQEIFLGIGGIRALQALGIHKSVYHCNEG